MTRKDYIIIAAALFRARPMLRDFTAQHIAMEAWRIACDRVASACEENAGRGGFDRDRFMSACGVES